MRPAAPGLRAAPSQAAAPILDWPRAPPNTAMAKPTPAAIAFKPALLAAAFSAAALACCANAEPAANITAARLIRKNVIFLIVLLQNFTRIRTGDGRYDFARIR